MSVRRLNIALLLATSILAAPRLAPAQDTLTIIGATKLSLPDQAPRATRTVDTVTVPVSTGATPPRAFRVRQLQWNGRQLSTSAVSIALVIDSTGAPGLPIANLRAVLDSSVASHAGEHTVVFEALWPRTGNTPARSQLLTLVFVAPTAELRNAGARRIEQTSYYFFTRSTPQSLLLDEIGRHAALVPTQTDRRADLVAPDGAPTGARIVVTLPARIPPNGQALAPVRVEGSPPLGKSTGTIRVTSPALAAEAIEVAIEVVTRPGILLILAVITLGIVAGYKVRVELERQRLRHLAVAAVDRELADAADVAGAIKDPSFKARAVEVIRVLTLARNDPSSSPEALQTAIQKSTADRSAIVTEMNALTQTLTQQLNSWLDALGPAENFAGKLGTDVGAIRKGFLDMRASVEAGMLVATQHTLSTTLPSLSAALGNAMSRWARTLRQDLAAIGEWPDSAAYSQAVDGLAARVQAMANAAHTGATPEVFREQLLAAGQVSRAQWEVIAQYALPRLLADVQSVHEDLSLLTPRLDDKATEADDEDPDVFVASLDAMQGALDVAREAHRNLNQGELVLAGIGDALTDVRKHLQAAAAIALKHVPEAERARIQAQVDARQFAAATRSLTEQVPVPRTESSTRRTRGRRQVHAGSLTPHARAPEESHDTLPVVGAVSSGITVQWKMPDVVMAGVPTSITITALLNGVPIALPSIQWKVDGTDAGSANQPTLLLTVDRAGNVVVEAHVSDASHPLVVARRSIVVGTSPRENAKLEFAAAERIEKRQTVVFGALIVAAGGFIFAPLDLSWGQVIFLPLLWGFTTDVGLARVRELATPLISKALPVPGA